MTRDVAGSSPARGTTRYFAVHFLSCAVVGAPTGKTSPLDIAVVV